MKVLRRFLLLLMAIGFAAAGYRMGAVYGTAGGLLLWGMAGTAVLLTQE
jgi:hypothetical protein